MPMHKHRTWCVKPAESAEWLAEKLVNHSWCNCQGWSLNGYLFLNDQTSPDGAFEVAIVKPPAEPGGQWWQLDSITFGWLSSPHVLEQKFRETGRHWTPQEIALDYINRAISGAIDPGVTESVAWRIGALAVETPEQHRQRYCPHCA